MKTKGVVASIYICKDRKKPRELIEEGEFIEGFGLLGDAYSQKGNRQVTILGVKSREEVENSEIKGLCFRRFVETIRTKDIDLYKLPKGTKLKIGDTIQEISIVGKRCFPECKIVQRGESCALSRENVFTKVLKSGKIKVGDSIEIL